MKGLVAYTDDSGSGNEDSDSNDNTTSTNDTTDVRNAASGSKSGTSAQKRFPDPNSRNRRTPHPSSTSTLQTQVIIRRPPSNHRNHTTRAHISANDLGWNTSTTTDDSQQRAFHANAPLPIPIPQNNKNQDTGTNDDIDNEAQRHIDPGRHSRTHNSDSPMSISPPQDNLGGLGEGRRQVQDDTDADTTDEMSRLRKVLRPPPIPGVKDWGIPPPSTDVPDHEVTAKLLHFTQLKHDPVHPKHFNDSLMSSRSFRNPHLYANLVDWAGVTDEKSSNFPRNVWDAAGEELKPEWFVENLIEAQRKRADKIAAAQTGGKRSHIDFSASSNATTSSASAAAPQRFQPYGSLGVGHGAGGGGRSGGKATRWG